MNQLSIKSIKQLDAQQLHTLIAQLEQAMLSEMPYEQKIKLNSLIGKCINFYISKK